MDDITVNFFEYFLKDLLMISIIFLVRFILTSYVNALVPLNVSQVVSSNQQNLANLAI
jgi:hypothetical protein